MKRTTGLTRKHWMRRVGVKRSARLQIYARLKENFIDKHPFCEMPNEKGTDTCGRPTQQIHHMKGQQGDLLCDTRYWLAVCMHCHAYIEDHKNEARDKGVILYK